MLRLTSELDAQRLVYTTDIQIAMLAEWARQVTRGDISRAINAIVGVLNGLGLLSA